MSPTRESQRAAQPPPALHTYLGSALRGADNVRRARFLLPLAFGLAAAAVVWGAQAAAQKPAAAAPAAPAKPATYVGSETCQACHEDVFKGFAKNPHQAVEKNARWGREGQACESCHGPGSVHAETTERKDIRNPARMKPAEVDKTCLVCHANGPVHIGRSQNVHDKNDVGCNSCHFMHKTGPEAVVARSPKAVNALCAGCHTAEWASFQRPHHHKLPEGAMSCADCHDPHGSLFAKQIKNVSGNDAACLKCHGDKRGPFVFEHASVRVDGCSACHQPHGSANPRMLTRHEVRFVCLECHANLPAPSAAAARLGGVPPAFHDLRSPRYRNCTLCHVKIHGSNVNRALLR